MCARQKVRQEKGEFSRAPISCRSCAPGLFLLPQQLAPSPLCSRYYSISARADAIGCWRLVLRDSCGRWSARRASGAKVAFKSPFALKKWPHLPKNGNHSRIPPFDGRLSATQRTPKLQVRELGLAWSHVQLVHGDLIWASEEPEHRWNCQIAAMAAIARSRRASRRRSSLLVANCSALPQCWRASPWPRMRTPQWTSATSRASRES